MSVLRIAAGSSAISAGMMPSIMGLEVLLSGDAARITRTPRASSAATCRGSASASVTRVSTSSIPNTKAGATAPSFELSARTTQALAPRGAGHGR